jgi:allantoinase
VKEFDPFSLYPYEAIVDRPAFAWPNGARIAVWVVPNIEHFHLELTNPAPDVRNHARRDYGNRVGIWRLMDVLSQHNVRGTVALNSEVGKYYPRIMDAAVKLGWEFMGHGATNSILMTGLDREAQNTMIADTRHMIESYGGEMHGWLGPGLTETWDTLDLLKANGAEYVADWIHDDLPVRMNNGLYSIPYTIELNDMPLFNAPSISIQDFQQRIRDAFDTLYAEGKTCARAMCIALHPFLIGTPHRIKYLDMALQYIASHDGVWFATGHEIITAFKAQETAMRPAA